MECKRDVDSTLALQHYIMALVLRKVTVFKGLLEIEHTIYQPFSDQWGFLKRESSPMFFGAPP